MGALLAILATLFAVLFIIVPLLEKYGKERSPEELQSITRWGMPLMVMLIIAMAVRYLMG